jgi:hypothetical protein
MARKRVGRFSKATGRAVTAAHPPPEPTGEDARSVDDPRSFLDDLDMPSSPGTDPWAPRPGRPKPESSSRAYQVSFNDSSNYLG